MCFRQCWRRQPGRGCSLGCRNGWKESGRFLWLEMGKQQHGAGGDLSSFPQHSLVLPSCVLCPRTRRLYLAVSTEHLGAVLVLSQWLSVSARHAVLQGAAWQGKH